MTTQTVTLPRELVEKVRGALENWCNAFPDYSDQEDADAIESLQSALSQQAPSQLKWCYHCGEGATTFCRGALDKCPLGLNKIVAQGATK